MIKCISGCAACCIVLSISSPLPGMPKGKPAGVRCINLNEKNHCMIHDKTSYPKVCRNFQATKEICGKGIDFSYSFLTKLEELTK